MFLLVESEDKTLEEKEESGEGMFKTNMYLAKHNISLNSQPKKNVNQDTGVLIVELFHYIRKLRCFLNFIKSIKGLVKQNVRRSRS